MAANVSPRAAWKLVEEGSVYLDVRFPEEFAAGHVPGAVNISLQRAGADGPEPDPSFVAQVSAVFERGARLIVGCRSGSRSRYAVKLLEEAGFSAIDHMAAGWEGGQDAFGRRLVGWVELGLPVERPSGSTA
jgi:rhodanese-related sulfurtransferase